MQDRAALKRQRLLIIAVGAFLAVASLITLAAALRPPNKETPCIPYFLIHQEQICGGSIFLVHNGRKDYMGRTADLAPMPAPPQRHP